ncbi:MAG: acyl carrier protein, partial [Chloroflexi bacterium]|nr:acyl carrier protein [Chloroflexota bacterium]
SLDVVELIMALEEEFSTEEKQLEISDEEAESLRTVSDVEKFLKTKGVADG